MFMNGSWIDRRAASTRANAHKDTSKRLIESKGSTRAQSRAAARTRSSGYRPRSSFCSVMSVSGARCKVHGERARGHADHAQGVACLGRQLTDALPDHVVEARRLRSKHNFRRISLAWRRSEWTALDLNVIQIPYFDGRLRPMPYVLLQHNLTKEDNERLIDDTLRSLDAPRAH